MIRRTNERGLTSALNRGIRESKGKWVALLDCDFQHPPEKLEELFQVIDQGYNAVVGSRFLGEGSDLRCDETNPSRLTKFHGFLSRSICKLTSWLMNSQFTDWTSGLIAVERSFLIQNPLNGDYGEYFMQLLLSIDRHKLHAKEIPYVLGVREKGYSKTSTTYLGLLIKGRKYLKTLAQLKLQKVYEPRSVTGK